MTEFGARLKTEREAQHLSQEDLARLSGTRQSTIACYEKGTRRNPRNPLGLAKALNVTPEWLILGTYPKRPSDDTPTIAGEPIPINNRLPIIKQTEATMLRTLFDNHQLESRPSIGIEDYAGRRMYAMKITDDSMEDPTRDDSVPMGCHIFVDLDAAPEFGKHVVFIGADGNAYLRQYINDAGRAILKPLNKHYASMTAPTDRAAYLGVALDIYTRKRLV